ncbi:magnesium-translocating P-type ATPase [Pseudorhodobacter sp. W20_MBD10_FR17]|uniref:magnesium-translocating P-type ATPase n=1 Tax=Pseudorhodobacter sp. W20_MBD10_FR17 TaxID=3240266 RepID=UPI003F947265
MSNVREYWAVETTDLLVRLGSSKDGLAQGEAERRIVEYGENRIIEEGDDGAVKLLLRQFESPLVLILIFAAVVSMVLHEWSESAIILAIVFGSTALGFVQEFRASQAVQDLRGRLSLKVNVVRDGALRQIDTVQVVPGDIVVLAAGNLIPADGIVLEARDFLVAQAALTGESFPVEKRAGVVLPNATLQDRANMVFQGTSVRSGTARIVVAQTGRVTAFGAIAARLSRAEPETDFARGIRKFGYLLTRVMMVIVICVLLANLLLDRPVVESLLFSVALAVGLTPELLPAIISVTLSSGARRMADRGVIVRRLAAIENLGSADILCTDKTGTLTRGVVELSAAMGPEGQPSDKVLQLAQINAALETGIENPLDAAILASAAARGFAPPVAQKIDEIPYDFLRKRLTIVVETGSQGQHLIISKGAFDEVLACCNRVQGAKGPEPLDDSMRAKLIAYYAAQGAEGFRVLGIATSEVAAKAHYGHEDEVGLVFAGFFEFFDPIKPGITETLAALAALGVRVKVITGDNRHVAAHVGAAVGLGSAFLTGADLADMRDEALWHLAEATDIFSEIDPQQKERIVRALQSRGHSVAYLGDGINDAPALKAADVGISVEGAVDVARDSADIVLLDRDLDVLRQGIVDGRRTFANTMKYIQITTSANFGNMISMALGTLFLPFLPLTAGQILLNNFLSDIPSIAISTDTVDSETVSSAPRWNIGGLRRFMIVFGLISTVFDLALFGLLVLVFHTTQVEFQSTWFIVSLLTELAVVLVLRTAHPFWKSHPGRVLVLTTAVVFLMALALPYLGVVAVWMELAPLPLPLFLTGLAVVFAYVATTEMVKRAYYRHRFSAGANQG